jgi:hypothetical protein
MNRRSFCAGLAGTALPARRDYIKVEGDRTAHELLNRAFSVLAGRDDQHTLGRLAVTGLDGQRHFINDNVWWLWTDSQCSYHATYGWRPFFTPEYRRIDRATWTTPFRDQVTPALQEFFRREQKAPKVPPLGWLPSSYDPLKKHRVISDSVTQYYTNAFLKKNSLEVATGMDHGENTDYPLQNLVSALDWCLWERDVSAAREYLPKIDLFLDALRKDEQANGLLLTDTQASQVEYGHRGRRYAAHTHVYLAAVVSRMVQVARMSGDKTLLGKYTGRAEALSEGLRQFLEQDQWFAGALASDGKTKLGSGRLDGTPSDYFEAWHNVNAVVLGVADERHSASIVARLRSIPALIENHLTLVNYPARPVEEMDTSDWYPKAGQHVNAGWMWMTGASALASHALTANTATLHEAAGLMEDFDRHLTIDYYNDYGRHKDSQWKDRGRDSYSVTSAGAFGMLFRGIFDFRVSASALSLRPRLPRGVEKMEIDWPIGYGKKELWLAVSDGVGKRWEARVNGRRWATVEENARIEFPYEKLPQRAHVALRKKS